MKDANGVEYVMVPKVATPEMVSAADSRIGACQGRIFGIADAVNHAIAAAQPFVPPPVTGEVCEAVNRAYSNMEAVISGAHNGLQIIAAVQQFLGPALGLVPASWVEDAYHEGREHAAEQYECPAAINGRRWPDSEARKRIEGAQ